MTDVSRLQVLEHAREIAERVGAVKDGANYFEDADGDAVSPLAVASGVTKPEDICGVCIAGAALLAEVTLGTAFDDEVSWLNEAEDAAEHLGSLDSAVTGEITRRGTPYVLAVLDRMIEVEREQVAA